MTFIELKSVYKKIENTVILNDICLKFERKGLVFIVGKSGAGKSSLLNVIGQIDKEYAGKVFFDDEECKKEEISLCELRRSKVGFIFQDFNLLGDLSARDNIQLAMQLSETSQSDVSSLLEAFDIGYCEEKQCKVLSGGERQRVAIARALCKDSQIILADEPTGNLDNANAQQVFEVLKQISKERLVVVISHDIESAEKYADRIISMSDGSIVDDREVNSNSLIEKELYVKAGADTNKKSSNVFKSIIKQHLNSNKKKNTMIVIMCSMLLLFSSLVISMANAMKNVNNSISAMLENDKITIYNANDFAIYPIDPVFIDELEGIGCNKVLGYHRLNMGVYKEDDYISVNYKVLENDPFFEERMKYYELELPSDEREIIINKSFANEIFGTENCIGKKFFLSAFGMDDVECKVYDISDMLSEQEPEIYISYHLIEELYSEILDESSVFISYSESKMTYSFLKIEEYAEENELCYGELPKSANQVVINAGGLNSIISILELPYSTVSVDDVISGSVPEEIINNILGAEIIINTTSDDSCFEGIEIVGISEDVNNELIVCMNEMGINNIQTPAINVVDVYLANRVDNLDKVIELVDRYGYTMSDDGGAKAGMVAVKMSVPVLMIGVMSIITLILVFMFIKLATKINIMNQKQEIGIIKALGAENDRVKKIYLLENIILYGFSLVPVIVVISILQVFEMKDMLVFQGVKIYELNVWYFILVCIVGILTVLIAVGVEIRKITKLNLVDLLRRTN